MRAMVLEHPAPIEQAPLVPRERDVPVPGDQEILIRVHACGLCHTDLHTVEGELTLPGLPIVPGHQVVGAVESVGQGVSRWSVGDRVGVPWLYRTCGQCTYCRRGQENLCDRIRFTGLHADGGYEEYMVVHQDFAYRIPDRFSDTQAAPLLCAGVIGYRALRLAGIARGKRLGLFGFGASAHIALQIARHQGCEVLVFTRGKAHQDLARRLGASWTGRAEEQPPARLDCAVIFAPAGELVPLALGHIEKAGTLALAGIHMSPIPEMPYALLYDERIVRSVANSTRGDVKDMLDIAAAIPVVTEVEEFTLVVLNEALLKLKRSEIRGSGVVRVKV